jgi:hypothetical protein
MPKAVAGIMLNILPDRESTATCKVKVASKEIHDRLMEALLDHQRISVSEFGNLVKDIPELGGYRGYVLENAAHRKLLRGPAVRIRALGARSNSSEFAPLQLPPLTVVRFQGKNLMDIPSFAVNHYARPISRIFPTLDSFAVMYASLFFGAAAAGLCLVLFQMTVGNKHPPNSAILKLVVKRLRTLLNVPAAQKLPVALVFVTDPNGVTTQQKIMTKGKAGDQLKEATRLGFEVKQFAMLLGDDFTELVEWERARTNVEAEEAVDSDVEGEDDDE